MSVIRPAQSVDDLWIKPLFEPALFWQFESIWWRYWNPRKHNEFWLVLPELGFVHYLIHLRTGVRHVHEIAVSEQARGKGIGRQLMEQVGTPCELKTDADNNIAQSFYEALGFIRLARTKNKKGREFIVYAKY